MHKPEHLISEEEIESLIRGCKDTQKHTYKVTKTVGDVKVSINTTDRSFAEDVNNMG
jgi:hypothetical protein